MEAISIGRFHRFGELLNFRDSALFRIITGTTICGVVGSYTGSILQEVQFRDVDKTLRHSPAKRFLKGWIFVSFAASFSFFSNLQDHVNVKLALTELTHHYFNKSNLYHNSFTDNSISAYAVYLSLNRFLRRQDLLSHLTTLQLKHRAQKYSLILCLYGLLNDQFLLFKRRQLILDSLVDAKEDTIPQDLCPYILKPEDLEMLKKMVKARQISIWSYRKAQEGDIGGFVPIAVMQSTKKLEVERVNQEVNKRLSSAIKRLVEIQTKEIQSKSTYTISNDKK